MRAGTSVDYLDLARSAALALPILYASPAASDTPMNAGTIMEKMEPGERFVFISGIIEGLAMSRYMQDGKKPDGMKCIYDWFYKHQDHIDLVYDALRRYPDYPPGTVVDLLIRKDCPA